MIQDGVVGSIAHYKNRTAKRRIQENGPSPVTVIKLLGDLG